MEKKEKVAVSETDGNLDPNILSREYFKLPDELKRTCSKEEFHEMMTSHNSDIPIESVKFLEYPSEGK